MNKLKFYNQKAQQITEVFGQPAGMVERIDYAFRQFSQEHDSLQKNNALQPDKTMTEIFEAFLQSKHFAETGFVLATETDYFVLGYIFSNIIFSIRMQGEAKVMEMIAKTLPLSPVMSRPVEKKRKTKKVVN